MPTVFANFSDLSFVTELYLTGSIFLHFIKNFRYFSQLALFLLTIFFKYVIINIIGTYAFS